MNLIIHHNSAPVLLRWTTVCRKLLQHVVCRGGTNTLTSDARTPFPRGYLEADRIMQPLMIFTSLRLLALEDQAIAVQDSSCAPWFRVHSCLESLAQGFSSLPAAA